MYVRICIAYTYVSMFMYIQNMCLYLYTYSIHARKHLYRYVAWSKKLPGGMRFIRFSFRLQNIKGHPPRISFCLNCNVVFAIPPVICGAPIHSVETGALGKMVELFFFMKTSWKCKLQASKSTQTYWQIPEIQAVLNILLKLIFKYFFYVTCKG